MARFAQGKTWPRNAKGGQDRSCSALQQDIVAEMRQHDETSMQQAHELPSGCGIANAEKSAHGQIAPKEPQGILPMFVRAVWRLKRLVDIKQTLREMDVPSTRDADILGISGPDFSKMTRSLFDR
ncbi:hypothetical protein [Devosia salina]|nr:hypothetical protein [Devosia salina]QYO79217.1 hypothetical protein K1X15_07015 [Devosia salina]